MKKRTIFTLQSLDCLKLQILSIEKAYPHVVPEIEDFLVYPRGWLRNQNH